LDHDWQARRDGGQADLLVRVVRGGHDDGVEIWAGEKRPPIRRGDGDAIFDRRGSRTCGETGGDGLNHGPGRAQAIDMVCGDRSRADEADPKRRPAHGD
jgi:hypothetical protein